MPMTARGRWFLFLFLALLIGCAVPHPALERPAASPDAAPEQLLPPGRLTPFAYLGSETGVRATMPDGARMAALRYSSPGQAMGALKGINDKQKQQSAAQRSSTFIGDRGYLTYGGASRHGLVWTSGVWLFIAEAASPEALDRLVAGSPAGGLGDGGTKGGFFKLLVILAVGIALLALIFTLVLLKVFTRGMAAPPRPGVSPVSGMELRDRLLALATPERPFTVRAGEDTDLVAEWKIVDAAWWGVFSKAGLKKTYRLLLALDEEKREVRGLEQESSIDWQAGAPGVSYSRHRFRGISLFRRERGVGYGFKEGTLEPGKVYDYRFDTREIKGPIIDAVTAAGWRFTPAWRKSQVRRGPYG